MGDGRGHEHGADLRGVAQNSADPHPSKKVGRPPGRGRPRDQPEGVGDPYRALGLSVIANAIMDAHGVGIIKSLNYSPLAIASRVQAAQQFVWRDNWALRFWCAVGEVDPATVLRAGQRPPLDSQAGKQLEARDAAGSIAEEARPVQLRGQGRRGDGPRAAAPLDTTSRGHCQHERTG
jgi:hypothetical protein